MTTYRLAWAAALAIAIVALALTTWFVLRTPETVFDEGEPPRVEQFAPDAEPVLFTVSEGEPSELSCLR